MRTFPSKEAQLNSKKQDAENSLPNAQFDGRYYGCIKHLHLTIYSAFANACPLQTDTFLFPLIHSHNALLSSNKF